MKAAKPYKSLKTKVGFTSWGLLLCLLAACSSPDEEVELRFGVDQRLDGLFPPGEQIGDSLSFANAAGDTLFIVLDRIDDRFRVINNPYPDIPSLGSIDLMELEHISRGWRLDSPLAVFKYFRLLEIDEIASEAAARPVINEYVEIDFEYFNSGMRNGIIFRINDSLRMEDGQYFDTVQIVNREFREVFYSKRLPSFANPSNFWLSRNRGLVGFELDEGNIFEILN